MGIYSLILAAVCGLLGGVFYKWLYFKRKKFPLCIGDMVVIKGEDSTTLSLEVDDLFEKIEHEKEVSFRVKVSQE